MIPVVFLLNAKCQTIKPNTAKQTMPPPTAIAMMTPVDNGGDISSVTD
jgi:hypothetical protein